MKRVNFNRCWSFLKSQFLKKELTSVSGNIVEANSNEPKTENAPRVVISSADDSEISAITSKFSRIATPTHRQTITSFLLTHPKAYTGFTTVELYTWLDKTIGLQPISKTLNKMKVYGLVESISPKENARAKVWKLLPKK
jgi:hypothetical protein